MPAPMAYAIQQYLDWAVRHEPESELEHWPTHLDAESVRLHGLTVYPRWEAVTAWLDEGNAF